MQIDSTMVTEGDALYYNDDFRNVLEAHMNLLRLSSSTQYKPVEPIYLVRYQFDLFGLFAAMGMPSYMHWIAMRILELNSPRDNIENIQIIPFPDARQLSQIKQAYASKNTVS